MVTVSAKIKATVYARAKIWRGVKVFKCFKSHVCKGSLTGTADIDFAVSFTVNWNARSKDLSIKTSLANTNVR